MKPKDYHKSILLHEYTISKMLNHKYIRKTINIDLKTPCVFLEYFEGIDMYDFLNNTNLELKEKLQIFKKIVEAIHYMHSKYVAHLDLKLENIMINPDTKEICIIDFGKSFIWKKGDKNYKLINMISSYEYMAPEEFTEKNKELLPDKIDIWGLGLILYCIIYEKFPWKYAIEEDNQFQIHNTFLRVGELSPIMFREILSVSKIQFEHIKYLFKNTLSIDPKNRINTYQILNTLTNLI